MTDLFGHPALNRPARAATARRLAAIRLAKMHACYGHGPAGQTCKDCVYLSRVAANVKIVFKCSVYGDTRSEASDWRGKWPACGKFQVR
jgi:hypothetical protein